MSARVFVGNLSYQTTREELVELLSRAGGVVDVHVPTDRETGRPRGFAFVGFSSEAAAADAIRLFDGFEVGGRKLSIRAADDRPPRGGPARPDGRFGSSPGGQGFDHGNRPPRRFKTKGSRRGLRGRKRSL